MGKLRVLLMVLLSVRVVAVCAQSKQELVKDLREEWMVAEQSGGYRRFNHDEGIKTIFFILDASRLRGDVLRISDDESFSFFVNQKLVVTQDKGALLLDLDSLSLLYSSNLSVGIFQKSGINSLSCQVYGPSPTIPVADQNVFPRRGNFFLDFSLIATLIVLIYLVILLRTHPRLTLDYLNVSKLFSSQEREENLLASRVTSRVNVLFYIFCSLFSSLTLLVVFQLSKESISLATYFPIHSTLDGFLRWMELSLLIVLLLVLKLGIVFLFSMLFRLKDIAAIQYFNFIRALFLGTGLITLIATVNFILYGQYGGLHSIWLKIGAGVLVLAAGMMYLKLMTLTRYHFFHLFSYLCASEIIPLVILLKILLY